MSQPNPFTSIVGLRGLNNEPRLIYVNDLPGISTELVTALRKDDQTVADTWARINDLALSKLSATLETEFNKSGEFKHTVAQSNAYSSKAGPVSVTGTTRLQGVRITVPYSRFRTVAIDTVTAFAAGSSTVTLPVTLIDLRSGVQPSTVRTVEQPTGQPAETSFAAYNVVVPMWGCDLFVGVDPTGLTLTELGGPALPMLGNSSATMTTGSLAADNLTASGFEATDCRVWFNVKVCNSIDSIIAAYASELADAFRHLVGSCLMDDKRGSTRINLYTSTNLEFAAEKAEKYECDALKLLKPIARRILTDLANVPGPVVQADNEVQAGYYRGSMLG